VKLGSRILRKLRALAIRTLPAMIDCETLDGFIVDYLDEVLPEAQRRRFERHIRMCPDCHRYLEKYQRTIALSQTICRDQEQQAPQNVPEQLVEAILAALDKDT